MKMNENLGYNFNQVVDKKYMQSDSFLGFETTSQRFPYHPFAGFLEKGLKIPLLLLIICSNCDESINRFDRYCDQLINQNFKTRALGVVIFSKKKEKKSPNCICK